MDGAGTMAGYRAGYAAIVEVNLSRSKSDHINKSKFGLFCETRWEEKHTIAADFDFTYEPLQVFLESIGFVGSGWDSETVSEAYGLYKQITRSTFIATFQTVIHFFGYIRGLSSQLQRSITGHNRR